MPIDYITVHFSDNYTVGLLDRLRDHETDLSPGEAYEIDLEIRANPTFLWSQSPAQFSLDPGLKHLLLVKCSGKLGW